MNAVNHAAKIPSSLSCPSVFVIRTNPSRQSMVFAAIVEARKMKLLSLKCRRIVK